MFRIRIRIPAFISSSVLPLAVMIVPVFSVNVIPS
jgi:hypothetical protein